MANVTQEDVFDILELFRRSRFARIELRDGSLRIAVDCAPASAADYSEATTQTIEIVAPQLGCFETRVSKGERVDVDTTVGVVRVLDSAIEVKAGVAGTVLAVFANDDDLVEFKQPLMRIATTQ